MTLNRKLVIWTASVEYKQEDVNIWDESKTNENKQ